MKRGRKVLAMVIAGLFVAAAIGSCVIDVDLPKFGLVENGDTGNPLKNVIVSVQLYRTDFHHTRFLDLREGLTGASGMYMLWPGIRTGPWFSVIRERTYFKPGFFLAGPTSHWTYRTRLFGMRHFLNFRYYRTPTSPKPPVFKHSEACSRALEEMKRLTLTPMDEKGVFKRLEGRKFTRMYTRIDLALGKSTPDMYMPPQTPYPRRNPLYYVFDEAAQEWLIIDSRGETIDATGSDLPQWEFAAYSPELRSIIYASRDSIFHSVSDSPLIMRDSAKKKWIIHIHPQKGNISGLAGTSLDFLTIEGKGKFLCHYGVPSTEKLYYRSSKRVEPVAPYCLKCFTVSEFVDSAQREGLKDSTFTHVSTEGSITLVCIRTPDRWYVYRFSGPRSRSSGTMETGPWIRNIGSFSTNREISAIAVSHRPHQEAAVYVAFRNEGIRKFRFPWKPDEALEEERAFFDRSEEILKSEIRSVTVGSAVNVPAVYATTGDDRILRFAVDGTPDYLVKWTQTDSGDSH